MSKALRDGIQIAGLVTSPKVEPFRGGKRVRREKSQAGIETSINPKLICILGK